MGHLERGEKNVSFNSILRIANALNITLSDLLSGVDGGEPNPELPNSRNRSVSSPERHRLLREIASLERTVRALRDIAGMSVSVRSSSARRKTVRSRQRD